MGHHHFDDIASAYDDVEKRQRARQIAAAIRSAVAPSGVERCLEYGAGTGLVAQALAPYVGPITLADSSPGMRRVAQQKITEGELPAATRLWDLDLTEGHVPQATFDLIISSLVLHHIADLAPVLGGFHRLLAPGGHLAVADLDAEDGSFHSHLHDFDGHDGFDRAGLVDQVASVGFAQVRVSDCSRVVKDGRTFPVFLLVARR